MATKLERNELPKNHTREDFECFGPVATKDTDFGQCRLADFGCFKQDEGVDSNKFYHVAVVKSKKNSAFYRYVEYGRTNNGAPASPQYQFTECSSEAEAIKEFVKQCEEKNTKRGQWEKVGSKERYVPKVKKDGSTEDLYVVRYMASRCVGLPAASNICNQDAVAAQPAPVKTAKKKASRKIDVETRKLFRDLLGGAVTYTRSTMVGGTLPALSAIVDARDLLDDALKQLKTVGNKVEDQVADATLRKLTYNLYGMIPKVKPHGAPEKDWILSQDNIGMWQNDLDAFETALKSGNIEETEDNDDVMQGIPADVQHIPLNSDLGKHLSQWWPMTGSDSYDLGKLKVHNLWSVRRHGDEDLFKKNVEETAKEMPKKWNNERPKHIEKQKQRPDLTAAECKQYWNTNVALLFHGSRSVNVPGIIRENFRFPSELRGTGVVINGAMFGGGVYSADTWSKSSHYCSSPRSIYSGGGGGVAGRRAFMFACDVILGHPYVASEAEGFTKPPSGHHCVFGKADHTRSWGGKLLNNEWIVYRKGRILMRYLAEVSW